ncbi:MAG TPA: dihydrofolate reductase family protein [Verrucomicrobiae bacterium]|nr:dihydrofolate reductase family protein [Verrucomicrobiae bacterium]
MLTFNSMYAIRTLFERGPLRTHTTLPERLRAAYDGHLRFHSASRGRPYVIANFVSTMDGIVTFNMPGQLEGKQISGSNEGDRFIMGLLRASADAVIVAAGTFQASGPKALWTPEAVHPPAANLYRQYRKNVLKKPAYPLVVIVSGTADLNLASATFHKPELPVVIITTERGKRRLAKSGVEALAHVRVKQFSGATQRIAPALILKFLTEEYRVRLLLHEGGPTFFGEFLAGKFVDELFLTLAPQIAGSVPARPRPNLAFGIEFSPATAPWWNLVSAKQAGSYLYLRFQRKK